MPEALAAWIHGGYAQTELGHGSNVQGIETTATFDQKSDSFIVHTPHVRAYKFWPGDLGYFATHVILMARLIVGENDLGPHAFIVKIRDCQTHKPLPGIDVGDIGLKFGFNQKDNGYLGFTNYKIPWENMLMKYSSLSKEGKYQIEGDPQMLYVVLLEGRISILKYSGYNLSKALTIAIWYAVVRT